MGAHDDDHPRRTQTLARTPQSAGDAEPPGRAVFEGLARRLHHTGYRFVRVIGITCGQGGLIGFVFGEDARPRRQPLVVYGGKGGPQSAALADLALKCRDALGRRKAVERKGARVWCADFCASDVRGLFRPVGFVQKANRLILRQNLGWGTWIRTRTNGVRVRGSTVNLFPNAPVAGFREPAGRPPIYGVRAVDAIAPALFAFAIGAIADTVRATAKSARAAPQRPRRAGKTV